jgi:DHA2 family multidrug resistance protein-like MFS transporter
MLASWWWGSVFLMGVPVMLLSLGTARTLLPEYRDPAPGRMDLASVALFLLAVLPVVYAIKSLASGASTWEPAAAFLAGAVSTVAFVRRQNRLATPLLDLRLFHDRAFTGALLTLLLGMTALNGVEYLVPQYLQAVAGQSPLEAGLWLLPGAAGLIAGSQLTPVLARRIRPAYVLVGGLLLSLTGYAAIALSEGVLTASLGLAVILFGVAPISVLGTVLAVGAAPEEKAGAAAATGQTAYDLGLALGIAATGTLAFAVYRGEIPDDAPAAAKDTMGAAIAAAERLPDGAALLASAKDAFTTGLQTAATMSAGLALVTAVLAATLLRHIPAIGAAAASAETGTEPETAAGDPVTAAPRP